MCMQKQYESCPRCGELVHASEIQSSIAGFCNPCEDRLASNTVDADDLEEFDNED